MEKRTIQISLPSMGQEEWEATKDPIFSGWITQGPRVAEFERLFPEPGTRLDHILVNTWREARALAGWKYDTGSQAWRRSDGSVVAEDDGREWRHL